MKTEEIKSFNHLTVGKCFISVNPNGGVDMIRHGKTLRFGSEAKDYVAARPKLSAAVQSFATIRAKEIDRWLHETPHHRYYSDAGNLSVRINGNAVLQVGNGGDGSHAVYVVNGVPDFFMFTGFSIGPCVIEPLEYDCEGGEPICRHEVKSAYFYRFDDNIAIAIEDAG